MRQLIYCLVTGTILVSSSMYAVSQSSQDGDGGLGAVQPPTSESSSSDPLKELFENMHEINKAPLGTIPDSTGNDSQVGGRLGDYTAKCKTWQTSCDGTK